MECVVYIFQEDGMRGFYKDFCQQHVYTGRKSALLMMVENVLRSTDVIFSSP